MITPVVLTLEDDLKVIKTDLQEDQIKAITDTLKPQLLWYIDYARLHGNSHYAVGYEDVNTLHIIPKSDSLDFRLHDNSTIDHLEDSRAVDLLTFTPNSYLIDVGSRYKDFVLFSTTDEPDTEVWEHLLEAAHNSVSEEREVGDIAKSHPVEAVRRILQGGLPNVNDSVDKRVDNLGHQRNPTSKARVDDCSNKRDYISRRGQLAQDRTMKNSHGLCGGVVGQAFCFKNRQGPTIDVHGQDKSMICHSTAAWPIAYSIEYRNISPCKHKMGAWEHHGCRKGKRTDTTVSPGSAGSANTNVYSWTIVF